MFVVRSLVGLVSQVVSVVPVIWPCVLAVLLRDVGLQCLWWSLVVPACGGGPVVVVFVWCPWCLWCGHVVLCACHILVVWRAWPA